MSKHVHVLMLFSCVTYFPLELYYDRGNHHEFVSLVKDLARPGEMAQSQTFDFEFTHVEKPYESYTGQNVKLRYVLLTLCSSVDCIGEFPLGMHNRPFQHRYCNACYIK